MIKVLVVDDETRTRIGVCTLISQSNLPVEVVGAASNGEDALELAKEILPDIILTDVRMPRMDGMVLAGEIRAVIPDCQIVFLSGYSDKAYLKTAIRLKAVSYLEKPIDGQELADTLKSCIAQIEENRKKRDMLLLSESIQQKHKDSVGNRLAIELLKPQLQQESTDSILNLFPDFWHADSFCTMLCQLKYTKEQVDNSMLAGNRLQMILKENEVPCLIGMKKSDLFVIHIGRPRYTQEVHMREELFQIWKLIAASLSDLADVFLAVGNMVESCTDIYLSYMNAVICLKKMFFIGYNHVSFYSPRDAEMQDSYQVDDNDILKFKKALDNDKVMEAESIVNRLFHEMKKEQYLFAINSIKNVYYRLCVTMDNVSREHNLPLLFPVKEEYIWNKVAEQESIFVLQEMLREKLAVFAKRATEKGGNSALIRAIRQYVAENYQDTELSLGKMAEELHFTAAHLCNVFKKETGETIVSYINTYRIEKAKELLKKQETRIYDVSFTVGYVTPHYFGKQFKKVVGMTPSEYREKCMV